MLRRLLNPLSYFQLRIIQTHIRLYYIYLDGKKTKPIAKKAIKNSAWCLVWTNDGKHFFYNPMSRKSSWKIPEDIGDNTDVDELLQAGAYGDGIVYDRILYNFTCLMVRYSVLTSVAFQ